MSRAHFRSHVIRLLVLLSLAFLAGSPVEAAATTNPLAAVNAATPGPVLTGAACTGEGQGVLMVTGEQFTPGGEVTVMLFVPGKADPDAIRSIRASQSIFGPDGSTDPARGFQQGGVVGIALGSWCQEARMVRAYDFQRRTWSNGLNVALRCEPAGGSHAVPPNRQFDPVAVRAAANWAHPARIATRQDAAGVTRDLAFLRSSSGLLSTSIDPVSTNHRRIPIVMDEHQPPEHDPTGPGDDVRRHRETAVSYHLIELEMGSLAESAHSAAMPLDHDLRVELAAMAAGQHRRPVVK